jgi:maltodextrin utilization protein YvdJ
MRVGRKSKRKSLWNRENKNRTVGKIEELTESQNWIKKYKAHILMYIYIYVYYISYMRHVI